MVVGHMFEALALRNPKSFTGPRAILPIQTLAVKAIAASLIAKNGFSAKAGIYAKPQQNIAPVLMIANTAEI